MMSISSECQSKNKECAVTARTGKQSLQGVKYTGYFCTMKPYLLVGVPDGKVVQRMNRQEAIKYLEQHKYYDTCGQKSLEESNKAIDMAIEALQDDWIPVSERLPKAEDMYQPPEQRYLCQLEAYGERKFCVLSRLKGAISPFWDWYGVAVHDPEVIAWMPLPEPYKGGDTE